MRLRPYLPEDDRELVTWFPEERQFAMWSAGNFSYPLTVEQLASYDEQLKKQGGFRLAALDEDGRLIGHVMMKEADYENNTVYMGLIVTDPAMRGRGLGREMVSLAVTYAFQILKMKKASLTVYDCNEKAHRCYLSAGLRDESCTPGLLFWRDEAWGGIRMSIEAP